MVVYGTACMCLEILRSTTRRSECGVSPLSRWVVRIFTVVFDGAEMQRIAFLACTVRLTPSVCLSLAGDCTRQCSL